MKRLEEEYRRFFHYPDSVPSGGIWFRIGIWIILVFVLGVLTGRLL